MDDTSPTIKLKRGRKRRAPIQAQQITGEKHLAGICEYLRYLRKLYPHPNRVLFYDDVVVVYLLAFFNPVLRSLRCIEDASQLPGINRYLHAESVCKSTLSEANALFDPQHLGGLIAHLRARLPNLKQVDGELSTLLDKVRAVDGSYFRVAADVQWALQQAKPDGKPMGHVRLNCEFCLKNGLPDGISLSGDDGIGEGAAATEFLKPVQEGDANTDYIYLFDSGVVKFSYLREILKHGCHFLCSLRKNIDFQAERENPLTDADRVAGVLSDRVGHVKSSHAPRGKDAPPAVLLREVRVQYVDRHGATRELRLLSDLLDVPAHVIAALYKHRWQIELFFRWLKVHANFRHLTSHSPNGITLGFHIAVIAMLLTSLHTQAPLSKYAYNMMMMVANGMGTLEDILPILAKRQREQQLERERLARKRANAEAQKKKA